MAEDPKFVRLAERLRNGVLADLTTGSQWSISGRDVKPFPEDTPSRKFVRNNIRAGKLEACGRAEYEDVQEGNGVLDASQVGHQEHIVRLTANTAAKLVPSDSSGGEAPDADADPSDSSDDDTEPEVTAEEVEAEVEEAPEPAKAKGKTKKAPAKKAAAKKK